MVLFNYSTKELTAKVVYYGPGLCGKTTNLQWIHEKLPIRNKGKMLSLATETDRTLFFDFLPIEIGTIRGMRTRIQLYTVPGQVFYNATRRMVLKGADAVVFVCDSQEAMLDANLESFENMRQNLEANEIDPDEIPLVFQYNKRDLPNALPIEILNERMNAANVPFHESVAVKGTGVEETLKSVTKLVFKSLSARYGEGAAASGLTPPPARAPAPPRAPAQSAARSRPITAPPVAPAPSAPDVLGDLALGPDEPAVGLPPIELEEPEAPAPVRVSAAAPAIVPAARPAKVREHDPQGTLVTNRSEADEIRRRIANPGMVELEMDLEEVDEPEVGRLPPPAPSPRSRGPSPAAPAEFEVPLEIEVPPGATHAVVRLKLVVRLKRR